MYLKLSNYKAFVRRDGLACLKVREEFTSQFKRFDDLAEERGDLKLFVRAVATSSELGRARDLMQAASGGAAFAVLSEQTCFPKMQAVTKKFGKQAALLWLCWISVFFMYASGQLLRANPG